MINTLKLLPVIFVIVSFNNLVSAITPDSTYSEDIHNQTMKLSLDSTSAIFSEYILENKINKLDIEHVIIAGPYLQSELLPKLYDHVFLFVKGTGTLIAGEEIYHFEKEFIAVPTPFRSVKIEVAEGDTLHYLKVSKERSEQDIIDFKHYPLLNRISMYISTYEDSENYAQTDTLVNSTKRIILPKDYVPRLGLNAVEVAQNETVDVQEDTNSIQLLMGLSNNDGMVYAEGDSISFSAYNFIKIPMGTPYSIKAKDGQKLNYQTIKFFLKNEEESN